MNHDEIFNALKKCNQIGKKLATGKYILVSGMMIGYDELDPLETEAYGLSVCFIENKLLSKMDAIPYIGIEIDGNELYQVSQECKFIKFTVDSSYLNIEFDMVTTTDSSFNDEFMNLAIDKGYDKDEIKTEINNMFANNIDLYELYLNFKKEYKPQTKNIIKTVRCKIIDKHNNILKKSKDIINDLKVSHFLGYKELRPEIIERILGSSQPINVQVDTENTKFSIRIMKSLLVSATSKSNCEFRIFENNKFSYLVVEVSNSNFITCTIYKIINI